MSEQWQEVEVTAHRFPNAKWVKVLVRIRNNATGEIREHFTHEILKVNEEFPSDFNWAENNYSCDCNRYLFFQRAKNDEESADIKCSDGKYSVQLINPVTGTVYYDEIGT